MALGQVFSEYFGSPANLHFTNCSTITLINHLGLYNRPEVAAVPGDVSPTPWGKKMLKAPLPLPLIAYLHRRGTVFFFFFLLVY
jgi:hypothetical protein